MTKIYPILNLAGRILLALLFVLAGIGKLGDYSGTVAYMDANCVPSLLLPLVILLEIGGGLALAIGWMARYAALALALFSVASAVLFHADFGDQTQMTMFLKNLAIAGGLLMVTVNGAGAYALKKD